jgi:hypothetical protein
LKNQLFVRSLNPLRKYLLLLICHFFRRYKMNGIISERELNNFELLDIEAGRKPPVRPSQRVKTPVKPPASVKPAAKPPAKPPASVKPPVNPPVKPPASVKPPVNPPGKPTVTVKPPERPSVTSTPINKLPQEKFSFLQSFVAPVLVSVTSNTVTGLLQFNHPVNATRNADGKVTYPDGAVADDSDGTITNADGSVTHMDGRTVYPNGSVFNGTSGLFVFADGTEVQAERNEKEEWVFPTESSGDAPPHP